MQSAASLSNAVNRLWLPRLPLTACMRAVMSRNSVGVPLSDEQRYNYFPASPLCSLSWWFAGESFAVPFTAGELAVQERIPLRATIVLGGPHNRPSVSWNPGPAHGMMLMLMPDAMQALTGIHSDALVNRVVAAQDLLPPAWMRMCHAVQQAADDDARVMLIEEFLDPLWQAARPASPAIASARYED
ncbi:MAG: AraC family transcriptional regulator, partial [Haliea sp.]